jgi:glutamate dehydrogenase (NADP+)
MCLVPQRVLLAGLAIAGRGSLFMSSTVAQEVASFVETLESKSPNQPEFLQAVEEVIESVMPTVLDCKAYQDAAILERLTEPDRILRFRVTWEDDSGKVHVNRAYRVEFSNVLGPYKGGMRFHPTVNESVLKFLGFEQVFKNSLTGLLMGGGKGGSDFDPKGKSDAEVRRFCEALMLELSRHIGPNRDVPAGDIGVGAREVGYMFGAYRRLRNEHVGILTGKGIGWGGSLIRTEATGYGCVEFARLMLEHSGEEFAGKRCVVSGSGNVAQYAAEKLMKLGATVLSLSDSSGCIYAESGLSPEQLEWVKELKNGRRGRIHELADAFEGIEYREAGEPWEIACDVALPCATQNEISVEEAQKLVKGGVRVVAEGANMPVEARGVAVFQGAGVLFGPGKAANAGGVAVSGLEMAQNAGRLMWPADQVEGQLNTIMGDIHRQCLEHGTGDSGLKGGVPDYVRGANVAGFIRVADAMLAQGLW